MSRPFLGQLREEFFIFSQGFTRSWRRRCPLIPFRVFMDHAIILSSGPMKQLMWSSLWQEIVNNWKLLLTVFKDICLNLYQDGEGPKSPPTSFSPVTSTNVGFGPKNFLTFSFNPYATIVQNFKFIPFASPKLLNLNQDHPSKKAIFLVKSL